MARFFAFFKLFHLSLTFFDRSFPLISRTEVTETLICDENRVEPIQRRSEEENEGQHNITIDSEKNNSDANLEDIKLLLEKRIKGEFPTDNVASDVLKDFLSLCRTKSKISVNHALLNFGCNI